MLRSLAVAAALTAVTGAIVMRRWDTQAGRRVAELTRARAGDEWRFEEQVAELESDLEESRELRNRLEEKLRAKRAELAGLRNEHASLLRRYATAESERATALENRRLLAIEASSGPATAPALTSGEPVTAAPGDGEGEEAVAGTGTKETLPGIFSPAGAELFLRAGAALNRIGKKGFAEAEAEAETEVEVEAENASGTVDLETAEETAAQETITAQTDSADDGEAEVSEATEAPATADTPVVPAPSHSADTVGSDAAGSGAVGSDAVGSDDAAGPADPTDVSEPSQPTGPTSTATGDGFVASGAAPALPSRSSGHFTVPTAVAVVPAAPRRRPAVEGGFDFFGTQKNPDAAAGEDVRDEDLRNHDLADVAGEEALAPHKAEGESAYKPADDHVRDAGQVIDLTAHDETERIDLEGLRSAAS